MMSESLAVSQHIVSFGEALALSALATPVVRTAAERIGFCDAPGDKKMHLRTTPLLGGIGVAAAFSVALIHLGNTDHLLMAILAAGLLAASLGIWDDCSRLRPLAKLGGQTVVAALLMLFGVRLELTGLAGLDIALSWLWIVGVMNALNLSDNMDGLSAGLAAVSGFWFFLIAAVLGEMGIAAASLALCGACLGFLRYNFSPASIFMGDAGSMFLGCILAGLGIRIVGEATQPVSAVAPALVLAVPIFDTGLVSWLRHREGRSVADGGKDHTSHRMVAMGLSVPQAVLLLYAGGMLSGLAGLLVVVTPFWTGVGAFAVMFGAWSLMGVRLAKSTSWRRLQVSSVKLP